MIYTSYFGKINNIYTVDTSAVFCAICGKCPEWYKGNWYKKVAPKWQWWKYWHDTYAGKYESEESKSYYMSAYKKTVLDVLDKRMVIDELNSIANGKNLYLLCFETPEKFCHRHLLANWLNDGLNEKIVEWDGYENTK